MQQGEVRSRINDCIDQGCRKLTIVASEDYKARHEVEIVISRDTAIMWDQTAFIIAHKPLPGRSLVYRAFAYHKVMEIIPNDTKFVFGSEVSEGMCLRFDYGIAGNTVSAVVTNVESHINSTNHMLSSVTATFQPTHADDIEWTVCFHPEELIELVD